MSKTYLIQIAVGPVQDFIASARKLRDLWFGSYILSELSKITALQLHKDGCKLIFPAIAQPSDLEANSPLIVANKILATYEGEQEPRLLIENPKKSWRSLLNQMTEKTIQEITHKHSELEIREDMLRQQMADVGEFFGVWTPLSQDNYVEARNRVEQLLAGRKNLREFQAPSWPGAGLPKNSLDGLRESVIKKVSENSKLIKKNEHLDAIGCVKRFYPFTSKVPHQDFNDLADISLKPWFKAAKMKGIVLPFPRAEATEGKEAYFEQDYLSSAKKILKEASLGLPTKYAGILLGDGDKMGAVLSEIATLEGHQKFSAELSRFASKAKEIVEEHEGNLVYAGGDDVLAYVPLHTAISCANELQTQFQKLMSEVCKYLKLKTEVPTFSIGMTIVHYQEPLSAALNTVRLAESLAKNKGERNALALILDKRSGAPITVTGKWIKVGNLPGIATRLENWISLYRKQENISDFSARLGYQLREARKECGDKIEFETQKNVLYPQNAAAAFVLRIFHQKEAFRNMDKTQQQEWEYKLFQGYSSIRQLSDELVLAHQFAELPIYGKEAQ